MNRFFFYLTIILTYTPNSWGSLLNEPTGGSNTAKFFIKRRRFRITKLRGCGRLAEANKSREFRVAALLALRLRIKLCKGGSLVTVTETFDMSENRCCQNSAGNKVTRSGGVVPINQSKFKVRQASTFGALKINTPPDFSIFI